VNNPFLLKLLGVAAVVAVLFGALWAVGKHSAPKIELVQHSNSAPLYEAHDKPMTIFLKAVEMENGRPYNITTTIRESKSRYNQMKQAVLAFLQGPRIGKFQVPVPEGMALNEFYFTPQGTAVVDISASRVKPETFGFHEETVFIRGLIEVLGKNFFEVKLVKILVDGQDAPALAGHYALGTMDASAPVSATAKN
jgi:hypothetical protein